MAVGEQLARRYRPYTLDGYIGNEKVKETVYKILSSGSRPQAIMLSGVTGCGKTTLARIIASWYMCENPNEDGSPCGECETCQLFKEYITTGVTEDFMGDVQEIDITDKSGKQDMDNIINSFREPSMYDRWKVFILDECHMATKQAQNRLLKEVEEPQENVLIVFCTTDEDAMLPTLKNRCQLKLEITKPTMKELVVLMDKVCKSENVPCDVEGLRRIAVRSNFVIRDSLNNLGTIVQAKQSAKAKDVAEVLNLITDELIKKFFKSYIDKDYVSYLTVLGDVKKRYSFKDFLNEIEAFVVRGVYVINSVKLEGLSGEEMVEYAEIFKQFSVSELAEILSEIERMGKGNIELNLINFMYNAAKNERELAIDDKIDLLAEKELEDSKEITKQEVKVRNDNIEKLNLAVRKSTETRANELSQEVSIESLLD